MKLSALFPIAQDLPIDLPTGEPTGIVLKVISVDGSAPRALAREYFQSMAGRDKATLEESEAQNIRVLASCVTGWTGLQSDDGDDLPFSNQKVIELLSNTELAYIREQVEAYVLKRANFFRGSETATR